MNNGVQQGKTLNYPVPTGVTLKVNQGIIIGALFGVVHSTNNFTDTAKGPSAGFAGDTVTIAVEGVFLMPKNTLTGSAVVLGGKVYWDTVRSAATGVSAASNVAAQGTLAVTTVAALNDTIAGITVNGTQLFAGPLTLVANATTATETQVANQINANTTATGYTATHSSGLVTITAPASAGSTLNTLLPVMGATTGNVVLTPGAFSGGVDATVYIGKAWQAQADADTTVLVKLSEA